MKKALSVFFVCTLLFLSVFAFSSCGEKPELDLKTAAKNLEANDYSEVHVYTPDDHDLSVGIATYLFAKKGDEIFLMYEYDETAMAKLKYEDIKREHEAEVEQTELKIKTLEKTLQLYEDDLSSYEIDSMQNEIKALKNKLEELDEEFSYGRSGKVVWKGSTDILEDTKK